MTTTTATTPLQEALDFIAEATDKIKSLTPSELANAHAKMEIYSALQGAEGQSVYTPDLQKQLGWTHACAVDILVDDDTDDACYDLTTEFDLNGDDDACDQVSKALGNLHKEIFCLKSVRSYD